MGDALYEEIPTVYVIRKLRGHHASSVTGDDATGIVLLVHHLAALGHRRIAHLAGPQDVSAGLERCQAFVTAMRAEGSAPSLVVTLTCPTVWFPD